MTLNVECPHIKKQQLNNEFQLDVKLTLVVANKSRSGGKLCLVVGIMYGQGLCYIICNILSKGVFRKLISQIGWNSFAFSLYE